MQTINRVELESLAGPNYVTRNGKEITADAHYISSALGNVWVHHGWEILSSAISWMPKVAWRLIRTWGWKESPISLPLETFAIPRYVAVSLTSFSGHKTTFPVCLFHSILIKLKLDLRKILATLIQWVTWPIFSQFSNAHKVMKSEIYDRRSFTSVPNRIFGHITSQKVFWK